MPGGGATGALRRTPWTQQLLVAVLAAGVVASAAAAIARGEPWRLLGVVLYGLPLALLERRWRAQARSFTNAELAAAREHRPRPSEWFDWRLRHALREGRDWDSLSWLSLRAIAASLNQLTATAEMIHELRGRWDDRLDGRAEADAATSGSSASAARIVDLQGATSFVVVGDTGEQDKSQYAVAPALVSESDAVDFLVISSDVVYPAGGVNDYVDALFRPYEGFTKRVFGVPGNHDWYDGLRGFMFHFCGQTAAPPSRLDRTSAARFVRSLLWRPAAKPKPELLAEWRSRLPSFAPGAPVQPGSYYAIDLGPLLLVCIDTGIAGDLDARQGRWLEQVSALPKDKLLITGRPLVVNQQDKPCTIAWPAGETHRWTTVAAMVGEPAHRYVLSVGGDIHNHQTYRPAGDQRPRFHLVSGGGGAFTSATHAIPPAPEAPAAGAAPPGDPAAGAGALGATAATRPTLLDTYPRQPESLMVYARRFAPRLWQLTLGLLATWAGVAAASAALIGLQPQAGASAAELADFSRTAEELLAAGAVAVGTWWALLRVGLGSRGRESVAPWRRLASRLVALIFGGVLAGAAWWLLGDGFEQAAGGVAVAAVLAAVWARILRGGKLAIFQRRPKLETAITLGLGAVAIGIGVWRLVAAADPSLGRVAAVAGLVVAVVVLPPLFIDVAQVKCRTKYQYAIVAAAIALAGGLAALDRSGAAAAWVPAAVAGIGAALAAVAVTVLTAYAVFFGALGLLFRPSARSGVFETGAGESEEDVARVMLAWQQGRRAGRHPGALPATNRRNRQITHIAMLGKGAPGSAVLDKTSEIFDSDEAPFQKSYLRFAIEDRGGTPTLLVHGVAVTGLEQSRGDLGALWPAPLEVPLAAPDTGGLRGGAASTPPVA